MWKLLVGFILFAAVAVFILTKSGGDVHLGGESHEVVPAHAAGASAPATAAPAASAASGPASAAST